MDGRRTYTSYSLGVLTLNDATMEVLFMRGEEPNAFHLSFAAGSNLSITVPWVVSDTGFTSTLKGASSFLPPSEDHRCRMQGR